MKNIILYVLLLAIGTVQAQVTIDLEISVVDVLGEPSGQTEVLIFGFGDHPDFLLTEHITTDTNGQYTLSFDVPTDMTEGLFIGQSLNCPFAPPNEVEYTIGTTIYAMSVVACDSFPFQDSCAAFITCDSAGNLVAIGLGQPDFTYLWSTGDTTPTITPTDSGQYCVTITDAAGCVAETCIELHGGGPGVLDSCYAIIVPGLVQGGTVELIAIGLGVPGFEYSWTTGETTETITVDSTAGEVCVTITDSLGCAAEACFDVSILTGGPGGLDSCYAFISCDSSGNLVAVGTGLPPFNYLWDTGDTTQTITPLDSGKYCVTITDAAGCVAETCIELHGGGPGGFDSCYAIIVPGIVQGGSIELIAIGLGAPGFEYAWSTGETTETITVDSSAGEVCVTITDSVGCVAEACIDVTLITGGPGGLDSCFVFVTCDSSGNLVALGSGLPPFTYLWNTGDTTQTITPVDSGEYCVTVTDASGCVATSCINLHGGGPGGDTTTVNAILGIVYFDLTQSNAPESMEIELYKSINGSYLLDKTLSITSDSGNVYFFDFFDLADGEYLVRAVPYPANGDFVPTYFGHTEVWDEAEVITLNGDLAFIEIELITSSGLQKGGNGVIKGELFHDTGFNSNRPDSGNEPLVDASVFLKDVFGQVLAQTSTDNHGQFEFNELAEGTYIITFDVINEVSEEFEIRLDEGKTHHLTISLGGVISDVRETSGAEFSVWPNPTHSVLSIELTDGWRDTPVELRLSDVNGRTLRQKIIMTSNRIELDLSDLKTGMYMISLHSKDEVWHSPVIKH